MENPPTADILGVCKLHHMSLCNVAGSDLKGITDGGDSALPQQRLVVVAGMCGPFSTGASTSFKVTSGVS